MQVPNSAELGALRTHPALDLGPGVQAPDRSIGEMLRQARQLDDTQLQQILDHQQAHQLRFGEAAVALGLATPEEVLRALSQQFRFPYMPAGPCALGPELLAAADPFGDLAEALRGVRARLMLGALAEPAAPAARRALAVVSAGRGEGKTFIAANLAVVFSQLGARTLLVDGDLRTPRLHTLFGLAAGGGLSTVLAGRHRADAIQQVPGLPSLSVLPAGAVPPNPVELLQGPDFGLLMQTLLASFDHVIVDTASAGQGVDARLVAVRAGAALAIGRRHATPMRALRGLVSDIARGGVEFAGVLINER